MKKHAEALFAGTILAITADTDIDKICGRITGR